jgi:hypothetical protein
MDETLKIVTDLVGSVGVPGAILILGVWKLVPPLTKFLEGITASLAKIDETLGDMKEEMRDLNGRLTTRSA